MSLAQLTGRTPHIYPNKVFDIVIQSRFGFFGLSMGRMNSIIVRSLLFWQFLGWNPFFGSWSSLHFPHRNILAAGPPFVHLGSKPINFCPSLWCPLLQILPDIGYSFQKTLPQCRLTPKIPRFAKDSSQPIRERSSTNSFNSDSLLGMAGDTFFRGIGICSILSSSRASGILLCALKLSPFARSSQCNPKRWQQRNPNKPTAGDSKKNTSPLVL